MTCDGRRAVKEEPLEPHSKPIRRLYFCISVFRICCIILFHFKEYSTNKGREMRTVCLNSMNEPVILIGLYICILNFCLGLPFFVLSIWHVTCRQWKGSERRAASTRAQPITAQQRRSSTNRKQACSFQTVTSVSDLPGSMLCIIRIPRGHVRKGVSRNQNFPKQIKGIPSHRKQAWLFSDR